MFKPLMAGSLLLVLAGCASQPAQLGNLPPADQPARFTLEDKRPQAESESETLSFLLTSCDYGIMRLADKATAPDKVALLKSDLTALAGDRLAGKTVVVNSYAVYFNQAVSLRGGMSRMYGGGLLTDAMINVGCKKSQVSGGWYEAKDITTINSPFIADLVLTIDGRRYTAHAVISPETPVGPSARDPNWAGVARDLLRKAAEQIARALPPA